MPVPRLAIAPRRRIPAPASPRRASRRPPLPGRSLLLALLLALPGCALAQPAAAAGELLSLLSQPPPPPQHLPDDWLAAAVPGSMPVRPEAGAVALQSPPAFTWPALAAKGGYLFRLAGPEGRVLERRTGANFLLLDRVLPPGFHAWQVRPAAPGPGEPAGWSAPRRFRIAEEAVPFPVPEVAVLWQRAAAVPHPRLLPQGEAWAAQRDDLLQGRRAPLFARFRDAAMAQAGQIHRPEPEAAPPPSDEEPGWWPGPDDAAIRGELEALERAALAWRVTEAPELLADARARLLSLLDWPADGPAAFGRNDLLALRTAWALAVAYDLLHDRLAEAERAAVRQAVLALAQPAFRWFLRNPRDPRLDLTVSPCNSHGYLHLANLSALAVILAGELPQAQDWFATALPLFLALPHPWGGEDGGSGNGGNYAFYYLEDLLPRWDVLRNGIGIDPAQTAWARNFPLYASYFAAPGLPFVFGDGAGHGDAHLVATVMRGLAARTGSRAARRFALQLPLSRPVPPLLEFTAPPAPERPAEGPDPGRLPDAAIFPSIGQAALHADLMRRDGAKVYFRSGPFGASGHSHADQNGFVLHHDGERLAIDSGYYDTHGSRHHRDWTRQTRAHNAITFDGGQGQAAGGLAHDLPVEGLGSDGRITAFADDGRLAMVAGDAAPAYGGALERAVRSLALLRPDAVLVYDLLESPVPRSFEWNIHALRDIAVPAPGQLRLQQGDVALCVEMLAPAGLPAAVTDRFGSPEAAPERADLPPQWHARFAAPPRQRMEFLALLRPGCRPVAVQGPEPLPGGGFALALDGLRIAIGPAGAVRQGPAPR